MRHTLNFTGRLPLPEDRCAVQLDSDGGQGVVFSFHAASLLDLGLPADAVIITEVYRGGVRERIHCGTVENPATINRRSIPELSESDNPQIRIRVVSRSPDRRGLVLAQLLPKGFRPEAAPTRSLLRMRTEDLGNRVWDINTNESTGPVLRVNNALDSTAQLLDGPGFRALVLPQVMREIALWLTESEPETVLATDSPEHLWITYIEQREPDLRDRFDQLLESLEVADSAEARIQRREWADDAADALAGDLASLTIIEQALEHGEVV